MLWLVMHQKLKMVDRRSVFIPNAVNRIRKTESEVSMGRIEKMMVRRIFFAGFILSILMNTLSISESLLMGKLLDEFMVGDSVYMTISCYILVIIVEYAFKVFHAAKMEKLYLEGIRKFKLNLVDKVIQANYFQASALPEGHLTEILTNEAGQYYTMLREVYTGGIPSVIIMAVAFFICLFISWQLTIMGFLMIPIMAVLGGLVSAPLKNIVEKQGEARASINDFIISSIRQQNIIKVFFLQGIMCEKMNTRLDDMKNVEEKMAFRESLSGILQLMTGVVPYIFFFIGGGFLVLKQEISVGIFYVFLTVFNYVYQGLPGIQGLISSTQQIKGYQERINKIVLLEEENWNGGADIGWGDSFPDSGICLKGVTFAYNNEKVVFEKLDMQFPANKMTAITGENGKGKSTLIKLLSTLYFPQEGHITYGGLVLTTDSLEQVREKIAYVPQKCTMFSGTIRENILMGGKASDEEIIEACKKVGIWEEILNLERGLDTVIENGGRNLSLGQIQRLGICRAMIRHPAWLFLDEMTSSLDPITRSMVMRTIRNLKEECTIIYVTHDQRDLQGVDYVVRL